MVPPTEGEKRDGGTLLVVGGTGELGQATVIAGCNSWKGRVLATYRSSAPNEQLRTKTMGAEWIHLDCSDHVKVRSLLAASSPRVSAVAYCAVPRHKGANEVGDSGIRNGIVSDVLNAAEAASLVGARFIAISTDLVFDGTLPAGKLYAENDALSPVGAYGKCKAEMEKRLQELSGGIVIARSSLILSVAEEGAHGKAIQFVTDCITGKHGRIELFEDELRSMAFADDLGNAIVELAMPMCNFSGVVHIVSDEVTNRWELAKKLARKFGLHDKLGVYATNGMSKTSGLNRPLNCALATGVTHKVLQTKIRGISERLG